MAKEIAWLSCLLCRFVCLIFIYFFCLKRGTPTKWHLFIFEVLIVLLLLLGLFVLLVLYVVGGAYLFYQRESEFEMEMKNEMMENHREAFINKVFWHLVFLRGI